MQTLLPKLVPLFVLSKQEDPVLQQTRRGLYFIAVLQDQWKDDLLQSSGKVFCGFEVRKTWARISNVVGNVYCLRTVDHNLIYNPRTRNTILKSNFLPIIIIPKGHITRGKYQENFA